MSVYAFVNASPDMAYPNGYSFFMSLMICVFIGFVVAVVANPSLKDRELAIFTVGFLLGGLAFGWLLGAFDTEFGLAALAGYVVGLVGFGFLLFRNWKKNG